MNAEKPKVKKCVQCKHVDTRATWACRACGAICCEHKCGLKWLDGMATCTTCLLKS
jgi:hypothetical protein